MPSGMKPETDKQAYIRELLGILEAKAGKRVDVTGMNRLSLDTLKILVNALKEQTNA